jgi:hypothetical protein
MLRILDRLAEQGDRSEGKESGVRSERRKRPFLAHLFCGLRMRSVVVLDFNQESEMAGENQTPAALWRGLLASASLRHGNVAT